MGKGIIRTFLLGAATAATIAFAVPQANAKDDARAAQAAVQIARDSSIVKHCIDTCDYERALLPIQHAASAAKEAGDESLHNNLKLTTRAFEMLGVTEARMTIMLRDKTNFETLAPIETDTYLASAKRLAEYLQIADQQEWDVEMRRQLERGIVPTLIKAIDVGERVAAHTPSHKTTIDVFKSQANRIIHNH